MGIALASADQKGVGMKYQPDQLTLDKKPKLPPPPPPKPKKKPKLCLGTRMRLEKEKIEKINKIVVLLAKTAASAVKGEKSWAERASERAMNSYARAI